jgi:hypothetical protein
MDEARSRVDSRLSVLTDGRGEAKIRDVGLACPGTDVHGPDLEREFKRCWAEFLGYIARGDDPAGVLTGMLFRTFWLGYAFGEAAER